MGFDGIYPLVIVHITIENGHRNSEFPSKTGDFPVRYVSHYQRVSGGCFYVSTPSEKY